MNINRNINAKSPEPKVSFRDLIPGRVYCRYEMSPGGSVPPGDFGAYGAIHMFTSHNDMVCIATGTIQRVDDFAFRDWREVRGSFNVEE